MDWLAVGCAISTAGSQRSTIVIVARPSALPFPQSSGTSLLHHITAGVLFGINALLQVGGP